MITYTLFFNFYLRKNWQARFENKISWHFLFSVNLKFIISRSISLSLGKILSHSSLIEPFFKLLDDNYNTRNMWQHQHSTSDISITRTSYVENLFCLSSLFLFYWTSTNSTRQKKIRGIHLCINWIKCDCGKTKINQIGSQQR